MGWSDTEATRGIIAWGELRRGKERDGSDDRVDGGGTVGTIDWGELRGEGAGWKRREGGRRENCGK